MKTQSHAVLAAMLLASAASLVPAVADAARGGHVRGSAATSVHRPAGGQAVNRPAMRPGGGGSGTANINRGGGNRSGNRINTGDVNIGNRTNINIDNDHDHGWDWDDHYHPVAAGVAFGTAAAITSAAIGSMMYSLPPACAPYPYGGYSYYSCGGVYYEPRYQGDKVVYVVVEQPR